MQASPPFSISQWRRKTLDLRHASAILTAVLKKRSIWLAALLALTLGLVGAARLSSRPREPVYRGKTLTYWLEVINTNGWASGEKPEAVRHIGTNAIPILLNLISTR